MPAAPEPDAGATAWSFDVFAERLGYLVIFAIACFAPTEADTFWMLRAGRDFWHTGHLPFHEHYSYTAAGRDWPNHEWLWEVLAYPLHQFGGMPLLNLVNATLLTGAVFIAARLTTHRGIGRFVVIVSSLVLLAPEASLRPQVASLFLFALTMLLVARERYLLLIPLFLVWANLHAAVATGGLVLVAASAAAVGHAALSRTQASRTRAVRLVLATAGAGAITLVNPMGVGLWTYVATSHARSKADHIQEWTATFHVLRPDTVVFAVLVCMSLLLASRRWRRLDTWALVVPSVAALATLPLAIDAIRNLAVFQLALIAPLIEMTRAEHPRASSTVARPRIALATAGAVVGVIVAVAWSRPLPRLGWQPMDSGEVAALHRCAGRVYATYGSAGYVEWYSPDTLVFVDSRQDPYPRNVLDEARTLESTGRFEHVFSRYHVTCAVLDPRATTLARSLDRAGWRVVASTSDSAVYEAPGSPRGVASD